MKKKIDKIAQVLSKQIDRKVFERKYAPAKTVLILVGAGAFIATALVAPKLSRVLKPYLNDENEYEVWRRFNIPYLKRTIERLEIQKSIEITEENKMQVIRITTRGRQKILKLALDELEIKKPKSWDRKWRLVSFDLPETIHKKRKIFAEYLRVWKFYPLHKSVYLHAYPCLNEIDFIREYLGIGKYVRIFTVTEIENDIHFRTYFDV